MSSAPPVAIRSFVYHTYDPRHADLFRRAWSAHLASGEIKPLRTEHLRALYESNPSGASVLTVASSGERWVGVIAGLATDVGLPNGTVEPAYQIGDFMVDEAFQRQGVGRRLLAGLLEVLGAEDRLVYTFPNRRSIGLFLGLGFEEIRSLRSLLFLPASARRARRRLEDRGLHARALTLDEAARWADEIAPVGGGAAHLSKHGRYLRWRFAEMREASEFHFLGIEARGGPPVGLVVSTRHSFRGISFGVVVDVLGGDRFREPLHCGVSLGAGGRVGFASVERDTPWALPALAIDPPARFQPRRVRLLVPPGDLRSRALFSDCRFTTADWMGF